MYMYIVDNVCVQWAYFSSPTEHLMLVDNCYRIATTVLLVLLWGVAPFKDMVMST